MAAVCGIKYHKDVPPCKREAGHTDGHNGFSAKSPVGQTIKIVMPQQFYLSKKSGV